MDTTNSLVKYDSSQDAVENNCGPPKYLIGLTLTKSPNSVKKSNRCEIKRMVTFAEFRAQRNITEKSFTIPQRIKHDVGEFLSFCSCDFCMPYRETILAVMTNHVLTSSVWIDLKTAVEKCYKHILRKFSSSSREMFKTLTTDPRICWAISDALDEPKRHQLDVISKLKIDGKLNFLVLGTVLQLDDAHQLFELLSYIAECFAKSFSEGFNDILDKATDGRLPARELITYMLNGYITTVTECKAMGNYLFSFENSHLKKFNLTWDWINRRMYKEHVYAPYADRMVDCIINLREMVEEQHDDIIKIYIKFDEQMTIVDENWKNIWASLNRYNRSEEDKIRRKRIVDVNKFFRALCEDHYLFQNAPAVGIDVWRFHKDRRVVWNSLVRSCRLLWPPKDVLGLNSISCDIKCKDCNEQMDYHQHDCYCVTCFVAGGPYSGYKDGSSGPKNICSKCIFFKREKNGTSLELKKYAHCTYYERAMSIKMGDKFKIPTRDVENPANRKRFYVYHISWALFKHLPDRKPYPYPTVAEKYFCKNCENPSCFLAIKILNNDFQKSLSEYLIANYYPMFMRDANIFEMIPPILHSIKKLFLYRQNPGPVDDDLTKILFSFVLSVLASYFPQFEDDTPLNLKFFEVINNDISLSPKYTPGNENCDTFFQLMPKIMRLFDRYSKVSLEVSSDSSPERETGCEIKKILKDMILDSSERENHEDEKEKEKEKEKEEEAKSKCHENHQPKPVFKKECGHVRVNHTRERLRKKLSQQITAKKVAIKKQQEQLKKDDSTPKKEPADRSIPFKICLDILSGLSQDIDETNNESLDEPSIEPTITNVEIKEENQKATSECTVSSVSEELPIQQSSLKDILRFIENSDKNKPKPMNDKKAAKKAKQKLKKEETKRIQELNDFRSHFHDIYFKEFTNKIELKELKQSKKKDKKKVSELENNIKKLNKAKSRIETNILELIATIKLTNSDFKFAYLPTKEQQQEKLDEMCLKTEGVSSLPTNESETVPSLPKYRGPTTPPPEYSCSPTYTQMSYANLNLDYDGITDPSKRIVTIRRINMPNVVEQVTVTEKGESADKDKLLYTFIKGQLMQTNAVNQNAIITHKVPPELAYYKSQPSNIIQMETINLPKKTKAQMKKDRKREIKLKDELEQKRILAEAEESEMQKRKQLEKTKVKNKKATKTKENGNQNNSNSVSENLTKSGKNTNQITPLKKLIEETHELKSSKSKKKEKNKKTSESDNKHLELKSNKNSNLKATRSNEKHISATQQKKKHKKKVQTKVLDNGQFDNNQFKMLHINDFESDSLASESESALSEPDVQNEVEIKPLRNTHEIETVPKTKGKKGPQNKENNGKTINNSTKNAKQNIVSNTSTKQNSKINKPVTVPVKENSNKNLKKKKTDVLEQKPKIDQPHGAHDQNANNLSNPLIATPTMTFTNHHMGSDAGSYTYNANVSIMEQLKRGVLVENLSLPPGITLTKVDPSKAEAIRIRNESIGKLSQPLQQQTHIANPIGSMHHPSQFFPQTASYSGNQSGVIMVETMANHKPSNPKVPVPETSHSSVDNTKSKKKRRKNKKIPDINSTKRIQQLQPPPKKLNSDDSKMVTLRNPMFHGVVPTQMMPMTSQHSLPPLPIDQPAAIIKNENGMFTIRNPALHQAVTNGGIYPNQTKQFTHQYYAPPLQSFQSSEPFSYFSNNNSTQNRVVGKAEDLVSNNGTASNKFISAIGSEIKKKQANQLLLNSEKVSSRQTNGPFDFSEVEKALPTTWMQGNHQQSNYNDFDIFPQTSILSNCDSGIFENAQSQHSCEDSPPPTITGYNRYLDGIPNTGIIRYNNASFLKTLMPGQKLNNEVTIHNVSESNFRKNNSSPTPHRVDITRIYGNNRPVVDDERQYTQAPVNRFHDDNNFNNGGENQFGAANNLHSNEVDPYKLFSFDYKQPNENRTQNMNHFNGNPNGQSSRSSPFLDDDLFVQNLNNLLIVDDKNSSIQNSANQRSPSQWWQ